MESLIEIFKKANTSFLKRDTKLILDDVSERCLCGGLMLFLHKEIQNSDFNKYYTDVEYNRNDREIKTIVNNNTQIIPITCDLIVHSRGENIQQDNLIAIEMKKAQASDLEKQKDRERLEALTKQTYDDMWSNDGTTLPKHVCGYKLGIYYEIDQSKRSIKIEYYSKGSMAKTERVKF